MYLSTWAGRHVCMYVPVGRETGGAGRLATAPEAPWFAYPVSSAHFFCEPSSPRTNLHTCTHSHSHMDLYGSYGLRSYMWFMYGSSTAQCPTGIIAVRRGFRVGIIPFHHHGTQIIIPWAQPWAALGSPQICQQCNAVGWCQNCAFLRAAEHSACSGSSSSSPRPLLPEICCLRDAAIA